MFGQGKRDKEEWLREAEGAYERIFGQRDKVGEGGRLATFSELEEEAVREGNQLARWLLEGKISSQAASSGCEGEHCNCPHCGRSAKRQREDSDPREIHTRPGSVSLKRYEYYCSSCRRSFFSGGPQAGPQG